MPEFDLDAALNPVLPEFPERNLRLQMHRWPRYNEVFARSVHVNPHGEIHAFAEIGRSRRKTVVITVSRWDPESGIWRLT